MDQRYSAEMDEELHAMMGANAVCGQHLLTVKDSDVMLLRRCVRCCPQFLPSRRQWRRTLSDCSLVFAQSRAHCN